MQVCVHQCLCGLCGGAYAHVRVLVCNNRPYFFDLGFYLVLEFGDGLTDSSFFNCI